MTTASFFEKFFHVLLIINLLVTLWHILKNQFKIPEIKI
ncbi:hypothetical protein RCH33_211 [Flavobacterium daejeonense]|nr:hypothetical protein RCH33_211 [Flavobacterium daejeonense]